MTVETHFAFNALALVHVGVHLGVVSGCRDSVLKIRIKHDHICIRAHRYSAFAWVYIEYLCCCCGCHPHEILRAHQPSVYLHSSIVTENNPYYTASCLGRKLKQEMIPNQDTVLPAEFWLTTKSLAIATLFRAICVRNADACSGFPRYMYVVVTLCIAMRVYLEMHALEIRNSMRVAFNEGSYPK